MSGPATRQAILLVLYKFRSLALKKETRKNPFPRDLYDMFTLDGSELKVWSS